MKQLFTSLLLAFSATVLLTGCIGLQIGGGDKKDVQTATVGQQLTDLQAAKATGAITEAEFQSQKAKLLAK